MARCWQIWDPPSTHLQKSIKKIESEVKEQKATDISKADDINEETFQKLDKKETTTKQEKQQVAKHFFQKVYGLSEFTGEAYNELSPLISKYSRLKMTKLKDFDNFVETYLHFESESKSDSSIDQLHRSKRVSRVFYGMKILHSFGFDNLLILKLFLKLIMINFLSSVNHMMILIEVYMEEVE